MHVAALAGALAWVSGCGDGPRITDAAVPSDATPILDAVAMADAPPSLGWVDFAVTGCRTRGSMQDGGVEPMDAGVIEPCTGNAPLELRFTAVAPSAIETHVWSFGDGQTSGDPGPVHVYTEPGVYDVSLTVAGVGGTASVMRAGLIQVFAAELGGQCTQDSQCSQGLECICGQGEPCPVGLEPGVCAASCDADTPCAAGVCADLAAGITAPPADWQRSLCLAACTSDDECPGGLTCQELRSPGGGWVKGCFAPGLLGGMGQSCMDAGGNPDHSACASGFCMALGARGICSAVCSAPGTCPASSACAQLNIGDPSVCLLRCDAPDACTSDPWLGCEPPGGAGALGFAVDEPVFAGGYCAPRTCADPAECGHDGSCNDGFCGP